MIDKLTYFVYNISMNVKPPHKSKWYNSINWDVLGRALFYALLFIATLFIIWYRFIYK